MSITSKIVLSALLISITLPAMAQGSNVAAPAATARITHHQVPLLHKVAAPIDITKPVVAHPTVVVNKSNVLKVEGPPANLGIGEPVVAKPAVAVTKPDALKVEAPKATVTTGIAKPVVPTTLAPAAVVPVVKVN